MARAIRGALALTTVALAMSGSGTVFAAVGVCAPGAPPAASTVNCDGIFNAANTNVPIVYTVEDLTVVLGATDPTTTVTTNGGTVAVDLTGTTGAETLQNYAVVTSNGGYAVTISTNSGAISVDNGGDVLAYGGSIAATVVAVYADSYSGAIGIDNQAGASIVADNDYGSATGVYAYSQTGAISMANDGSILVNAYGAFDAATGIHATLTDGNATIDSSGTMTVYATGDAYGIYASADGYGSVSVTNGGSMSVTSAYGGAQGVLARTSYDGDVYVGNSGTINVVADQANYGDNYGIHAYSDDAGVVSVDNSGSVSALSNDAFALGIMGSSNQADTTIDNSGTVTAIGDAGAIGINAYGYTDARVYNDGSIVATGLGTGADAIGIQISTSYFDVIVTSFGSITATGTGDASGIDAMVFEGGNILITTDGSIDASTSSGYADAYGIDAGGYGYGDIRIVNDADITVSAAGGSAIGIIAMNSYTGGVSITGSGNITASSTSGSAYGIYAYGYDGDLLIDVSGDIGASSADTVYGMYVHAYGDVQVTSGGVITATSTGSDAYGIFVYTCDCDALGVAVDNNGSIHATASGAYGDAHGIYVYAYGVYATTVSNDGLIVASSANGEATGIYVTATDGPVSVGGTGSITVQAYDDAWGIDVYVDGDGSLDMIQGGAIDVTSDYGLGYGILADSEGLGDLTMTVNGDVTVDALLGAVGIQALANGGGDASVDTGGDIAVTTYLGNATGILAESYGSFTSVDASGGSISATSTLGNATGIDAYAYSDAYVHSAANILADAQGAGGQGIGITAIGYLGDTTVLSSGSITVDADSNAYGIQATTGIDGNVYVTATGGPIDVDSADSTATGIFTQSYDGDITVDSSGDVTVTAETGAIGIGAYTYGAGSIDIGSTGAIEANTVGGNATGIQATSYSAYVDITASDAIDAISTNGNAFGIDADGYAGVSVDSSAAIDADGYSFAYGIAAIAGGDLVLQLSGEIRVVAGGGGAAYGYAAGVHADALGGHADFAGTADVFAAATADSGDGSAYAMGVHLDAAYADVTMGGASTIVAVASGYIASAVGVEVNGGYALALDLSADITAYATGFYGEAVGVSATTYVDVVAYNGGDIDAEFAGGYGTATGVRIASLTGDILFYNAGTITATASDYAVAVELVGSGGSTLFNQGMIAAYSDVGYGIAFQSGDAEDSVFNYGTITGAIVTGDGDDTLDNAIGGTWNAFGASDFGAGDDAIFNHGTINMSDAVIDLGLPGTSGNGFSNYGTITVSGAYNVIDMEGGSAALALSAALLAGPAAVPSSNPQAFYNYSLIDFRDGAPDGVLTIVGDFGGDGSIAVDVSGLNGVGDLLYIDGSIVSGSVNSIDVDLLDLPEDGSAEVPVVEVSGDSVASNFVLGSVNYTPNPFLSTDISLVSSISNANTSPDLFSLRVALSPSDAGRIAAVLPAGVQLLMKDVVGSWHKRVEDVEDSGGGKFTLWGRLYVNKGKVDPEFRSDGLGGGNFAFEQKNTGGEAGFDFAPNERFNFGLILGKANADQDLRAGLGSDRIEGTVGGGYGTFRLPRGFYFDLSHRRLKFDASLDTAMGRMDASGEAQSSNAESGYQFNYKGFEIEGQLQHTHTKLVSLDTLTLIPGALAKASNLLAAADAEPVAFDNDADLSSVSRVAVDIRKKFKTQPGTIWELHATLNRIRESGGENKFHLTDSLGGETDIGGDSSLVDLGFTARRGLLLYYGSLTWENGGALQDFFGAQLGAKYTW